MNRLEKSYGLRTVCVLISALAVVALAVITAFHTTAAIASNPDTPIGKANGLRLVVMDPVTRASRLRSLLGPALQPPAPDSRGCTSPTSPTLSPAQSLTSSPGFNPVQASPSATEPFTLVVLPDTQIYSESHPRIFTSQTQWIRDSKDQDNIGFVVHVGDLVEESHEEYQWANADASISILDGVVPYSLAVGNHDMASNGAVKHRAESVKYFDAYFPSSRYEEETWYGGRMGEGNENSFSYFSAGGMDFVVITLEFGPRDEVLDWANEIVSTHRDMRVIVATHSYMYNDETRVDGEDGWNPRRMRISFCDNVGEKMWDKFVKLHPNIFLVLSGHSLGDGVGRLTSTGVHGNPVHQLVANYQMLPKGGEGWLRVMRFAPADNKIYVKTYSPLFDTYKTDPENSFVLDYDMSRTSGR